MFVVCKHTIARTTIHTTTFLEKWSKKVQELISYTFLILMSILTPALKMICKTSSELLLRKESSSFVLLLHNVWLAGKQVWCNLYYVILLLWSFHCLLLCSTSFFFNLHAFVTMTDFYGVCVAKLEVGVWPAQLCCRKPLLRNLLCCKKCFCAVSLGKWTVTGIVCSGRTKALQPPHCGWISSALSVLPIVQLHQQNCSGRSSTASKLWTLWTRNCARLPLCA